MVLFNKCSYGDEDRRNRVLFEYHAFSAIVVCSLVLVFFGSNKLKRVYRPLYYIVNCILLLEICSDVLYFSGRPYTDEVPGNCLEMVVGRLSVLMTMFGELHQLYFIANVLGLSHFCFNFCNIKHLTLEQGLRYASILAGISIVCSLFIRRMFMLCHDIWALIVIALQLFFIDLARHKANSSSPPSSPRTFARQIEESSSAIIDVYNDAVGIFETISWLQIIPLIIALVDRLLEFDNIFIYVSLDAVMMILEFLSIFLFFVKVLVLQEKASRVNIEIIDV